MTERRLNHRFQVTIPVSVYLRGQDNGLRMLDTFCRDVSIGGAFIELKEPLSHGDEIRMVLHFAHRHLTMNDMAGVAQVVRRENSGIAVEFQKVQAVSLRRAVGL